MSIESASEGQIRILQRGMIVVIVPTQSQIIPCFLRLLENGEYDFQTMVDLVSKEFNLTEVDLKERTASGKKSFRHRMHWILYHLRRARLVEDTEEDKIRITVDGKKALKSDRFYSGGSVNWAYLRSIPRYRGDSEANLSLRKRISPVEDETPLVDESTTFDEYLRRISLLDQKNLEDSGTKIVTTSQSNRSQELIRLIRSLRGDECQVCGDTYDNDRGTFCDSHHVIPLRKGGTDTSNNIIIVCPSCHRRFHLSEIEIVDRGTTKSVVVPWMSDEQEIEFWQEFAEETIERS